MCFTAAAEAGKEGSLDVVLLKAATGRLMTDWWQIGGRLVDGRVVCSAV